MSSIAGSFFRVVVAIALLIPVVPIAASTASAQEGDADLGFQVWQAAPCKDCHGWFGHGIGEVPQYEGPNLRERDYLTPEDVAEIVRCGRPGTPMPSFRNNAWTEIIPCYGTTEPYTDGTQPPKGDIPLGDRAINNLVAYLFRDIIGKGAVTREVCVGALGPDSPRCPTYPTAAEAAAQAPAAQ